MNSVKPPVEVVVLTGQEAERVREQRFQAARARLAKRINAADLSAEEIMAEVQAFRKSP